MVCCLLIFMFRKAGIQVLTLLGYIGRQWRYTQAVKCRIKHAREV